MQTPNGIFSRFRIARYENEEVAVLVNRREGAVYAWRMPQDTPPLTLQVDSAPRQATSGQFYRWDAFQLTGGEPPYSFSIAAGQLPDQLSLNVQTGQISGVPVGIQNNLVTFQVEDANGDAANVELLFSVQNPVFVCTNCHNIN